MINFKFYTVGQIRIGWSLNLNKNQQEGLGSASVKDQKGFGRYSERFVEFRGFQFSERFQKVLKRSPERIQTEVLVALLSNAEPSKETGVWFLLILGLPDFDGQLRAPKTFVLLRFRAAAGLPTPLQKRFLSLLE